MFYQVLGSGIREIGAAQIDGEKLTLGYVSVDELYEQNPIFRFDETSLAACRNANTLFRSGVEVHRDYTFTELRILNLHEEADDFIALFLKRDLLLVVDISDADGSTKKKYLSAVQKYPVERISCEKVLAAFLDSLLIGDDSVLETIGDTLSRQEEELFENRIGADFSRALLTTKNLLSKRYAYYAQLMDIADTVCENDNGIFEDARLIYVDNVSRRIARLHADTANLRSSVEHLQDAYSSHLDSDMNRTMKIFTVLTSIFFPLTIIVGWYGMNFRYMPEFSWRFGYLYVILLSAAIVALFAWLGKKKKWF